MSLAGFPDIDTSPLSDEEIEKTFKIVQWLKLMSSPNKPILSPQIESEWKLAGPKFRAMVNYLRSLGDPLLSRIAATSKGYYWADNRDDAATTITSLGQRARQIRSAEVGMRKAFGENIGQFDMFL